MKVDLCGAVQAQVPETMHHAVMLAKIQQQVAEQSKYKYPKSSQLQKPPLTAQKTSNGSSLLWKEWQVWDDRHANNLCYFCAEKYEPAHAEVCTKCPKAQLNVNITEEVLTQLAVEDSLAADFCQLSLNAISGTAEGGALQLRALVGNKVMLILVDSSSSHSFVSASFVQKKKQDYLPFLLLPGCCQAS